MTDFYWALASQDKWRSRSSRSFDGRTETDTLKRAGTTYTRSRMKDVVREFLGLLDAEDQRFSETLKRDSLGVGFLTAIKELISITTTISANERTSETDLHFHLLQLGIPRVVAGILASVQKFTYPVATFKSDKPLIVGAYKAISAFGFVEQGRRMAHGALAGECRIERYNNRQYDFVLPDTIFNMEQHEASVGAALCPHPTRAYRCGGARIRHSNGVAKRIKTLLNECVRVFRESFIGYDAHPDLDDFSSA